MMIAKRWKQPRANLALFCIEFCLTVAALALFGIADPDLYRTRLWQDGADNGFNSSPIEILYSYANYRPIKTPLVWSSFITSFNVFIAVLSMFILLVKSVMYVTHTWIPILSAIVHFILLVLYATSVGMQASRDVSDAKHPQRGAPWYLTKSCNVVHNKSNYGYCQQAKAAFGVTVCMLALFTAYTALSLHSTILSSRERAARTAEKQASQLAKYKPARSSQAQPRASTYSAKSLSIFNRQGSRQQQQREDWMQQQRAWNQELHGPQSGSYSAVGGSADMEMEMREMGELRGDGMGVDSYERLEAGPSAGATRLGTGLAFRDVRGAEVGSGSGGESSGSRTGSRSRGAGYGLPFREQYAVPSGS